MYSFNVQSDPPLLKLSVLGSIDEREMAHILALFERGRRRFTGPHQAWFVFPLEAKRIPDLFFLKTQLAALMAKTEGLASVVIELQGNAPEMLVIAVALRDIFAVQVIPARITRGHLESRDALKALRTLPTSSVEPESVPLPWLCNPEEIPPEQGGEISYDFKVLQNYSVLKLNFHSVPSDAAIGEILALFCENRKAFPNGYQVWFVLPFHAGTVPQNVYRKADLEAYRGKTCGLRNVVIELQGKDPAMISAAGKLRYIYTDLRVPVQIVQDQLEARRALGMLWRSSRV